ncbi:hypothetical protein QBC40DRAFT_276402 [Triangularia verruculosa]|uniref:2EXR domain-containing protein n=1 Tax=Triangularia verruculosa TaxID=2587418 RepID=A0AAN6XKU7_9PEZI|nr:hypothetical protein QBC40DRAFT_276402 [Triangularia verruculosa]
MSSQRLLNGVDSLSLDNGKSGLVWYFEPSNTTVTDQQQTASSSHNKFHYFFDLPPELREQIIEHICYHPGSIFVRDDMSITTRGVLEPTSWELFSDQSTFNPYVVSPPVNLMLACAELYRMASEIYYGKNTFHLRLANPPRQKIIEYDKYGNRKLVSELGKVGKLLLGRSTLERTGDVQPTEGPRLRLRHVVVRIERFGGAHMEKELIPALGSMILSGSLKTLQVEVSLGNQNANCRQLSPQMALFQPPSQNMRRTTDLTSNPVMKALLVVLMDPDLEKVLMRVRKTDNPCFWCQCHAWELGWGEKSEEKPPMCFLKHLPDGNRCRRQGNINKAYWAEVNIPKLVQACGIDSAQFRIKKVEGPDPYS